MKDKFDNLKEAARKRMAAEADQNKRSFIRELKQGLGQQMVGELEKLKPPTRRKKLWNKIKKVLGL
jgi:hypothetical protein